MDKIFSNTELIHLYTRKRLKKSHNLTEEVWTIIFIPICSIFASNLLQFIFASFFWPGLVEVHIEAHARVAPF